MTSTTDMQDAVIHLINSHYSGLLKHTMGLKQSPESPPKEQMLSSLYNSRDALINYVEDREKKAKMLEEMNQEEDGYSLKSRLMVHMIKFDAKIQNEVNAIDDELAASLSSDMEKMMNMLSGDREES